MEKQSDKDSEEEGETLMIPYGEESVQNDIRILIKTAEKVIIKQMPLGDLKKTPMSLKWSRLSFGCSALDKCTNGGLVTRGITELCGAAGVGKTQILLQLALTVQLPIELGGLDRGVAYICTEHQFPTKRLFQMAKHIRLQHPNLETNYLSNVYVEHIIENEDLLKCTTERLRKLLTEFKIGLIVIDSVAAIFRSQSNLIQRSRDMRILANALLQYADTYNCVVVCVNHVTTVSAKDHDVPCLGLAWAHLGRTRIKISKVPKEIRIKEQTYAVRKFEVMYSPETPSEFAEFLITENGVVDLPH